ncbi:MAG: DUF3313 domain-containing protein [Syntrophales bacterium]
MKTGIRIIIAIAIVLAFMASPVMAKEDQTFSGFLGDSQVYKLLKPGPEGGVKLRWQKPGVDLKVYDKFMVDSVIFYMSDKSEQKGIDPQELKELADKFNQALVAAFKDKYPIVAEPGPDVARIRIAITNVEASKPGVSAVTSILPIGLGISLIKKGATDSWTGSGATSAEMMILDSTTNDVIGMAVDDKTASFGERFSKWGSAEDAFKFWSEKIVAFIDGVKGIKREPTPTE